MQAAALTAPGTMSLVERPETEQPSADEVLIKVEAVGVCGSDIHYYREGRIGGQVVEYPFVVGHEFSGIVLEVGTSVTRVKTGDRVAVDPAVSCGVCDQCRGGRAHTCRNLRFLGCPGQMEGCLVERIVMPARCCFPAALRTVPSQPPSLPGARAVRAFCTAAAWALPSMFASATGSSPMAPTIAASVV
jgi:L-iditol 2-dehydrogenase